MELIADRGLEALPQALAALSNEAMRLERERHLGVGAYERSEDRRGYANGYKPKRKVARITEQLCGFEVSSSQVSRCASLLDEELAGWRARRLGAYPYVVLDARRYEPIRHGGQVVDAAVLLALGVRLDGKRELLGASVALSEAEVHWRAFLTDLKDRGMHGMKLFGSDDHAGLKAARAAVFPAVPWQRCQFHLQQNAGAYVPRQEIRKAVAADIRAIFNAPDEQEAQRLLERFVDQHQAKAPKLIAWAAEALPQGFAVFAMAPKAQKNVHETVTGL